MFEYIEVAGLDAGAALGVLEQARAAKRRAEVQAAPAMLQVVKTYRHRIPSDKVQLAAEGIGPVDDFACLELGAALCRDVDSVTPMLVELLNLETRLPRLWETVVACGVPVWLARRIARTTTELTLVKALWIDATIAPFSARLAPSRSLRFVEALVVQADPVAAQARRAAEARPRVEIGRLQRDGLRDLYGRLTAVDAYDIPARLRRAVLLRHPLEVFPYGTRGSAGLDLDHTAPYRWDGTRGQTRPDNLEPLRRKAHRAKTLAGWRVTQPEPGRFTWTSPPGRRYVVTTAGLTNDGQHAPGAEPWASPLGGSLLPDLPDPPRNQRKRRRTRKPIPTTPRRPRPTLRP